MIVIGPTIRLSGPTTPNREIPRMWAASFHNRKGLKLWHTFSDFDVLFCGNKHGTAGLSVHGTE